MTTENSSQTENEHTTVSQDANTDINVGESSTPDTTDETVILDAKVQEPETLFDAVQAALKKDSDSNEDSSTSTEVEQQDTETDSTSTEKSTTAISDGGVDDEGAQPEFHKHPRWQKMLAENRELKERTKEYDVVSEKAQNMDAFNDTVFNSGLTPQEFNEGFEIMRAMKSDPAKALQLLAPHFKGLEEFAGQRLPNDLQDKVDAGHVDAETAAELAAARNQRQFATERANATEQSLQAQREAQATQRHQEIVGTVKTAISEWETTWKGSDPDYSIKQPLVHDRVVALIAERGAPMDATAAIALSDEARTQVNDMLSKVVPAKRAIKHVPSGGNVTTSTEPTTLKEVIRLAAKG